MFSLGNKNRNSFTLIELLVVLALVAILSVVVVLTLNPTELLKQARDSNRLSDLATINTALNLFSTDVASGFMGTSTVVYVSIADNASSTCGSLGLPTLPTGYTYNCATSQNLRNTDGTGWIPVNFQNISSNSPISQLPIDPINTTSTRLYYTYVSGGSWELNASIEASKNKLGGSGDLVSKDGGSALSQYEIGNNLNINPLEIGDTGLLGYWNFDEASGASTPDRSGKGNLGTLIGAPARISRKDGNGALSYNGTNQYVSFTNSSIFNFTSEITLSIWIKPNAIVGNKGLLGRNMTNSYLLLNSYTGKDLWLSIMLDGARRECDTAYMINMLSGVWYHAVGTYDGRSMKIYSNGVLIKSCSLSGVMGTDTTVLNSGFYGGGYYDGSVDEPRIYNRALSAAEILAIYNATK